jgi:ATP-binding cassette, subfamily B, bacterial
MALSSADKDLAQVDKDLAQTATFGSLKALIPFALAYKGRIAVALLALLVASGATLIVPLAVRSVIDQGFSQQNGALITSYFVGLMGVVAVLALSSSLRYYCVITLGERIVADLRNAVFRHLTTLDPAFFDANKSGDLVSRLTADTTQVKSAFSVSISIALRNGVLFCGAAIMMALTSPTLSGLVMLAIPAIVLPLVFSGRKVRRRAREAQDRLADASAYAAEAVGAVRTMQAFGMEHHTAAHFSAASENAYQALRLSIQARALLTAAVIFVAASSVVGILWYGAHDVLNGTMTAGRLSQFLLYAVFAASALGQLSELYGELAQAAGAAERLSDILATKTALREVANVQSLPQPAQGALSFEHVHFSYPGRKDVSALHDVSFRIRPGERVALVGPSGAGKSTILQLILRFYDVASGTIRLDGVPIDQVNPIALRRRIGLVSQEPAIFGMSLSDNIRYGSPRASDEDVRQAARYAAAEEFILKLPQGYDTLIGERGVTLSGGQRQRIAIARALLKNAPILLLDEATSALDAESERDVQQALDHLMEGRTSLVIAHRLATVRSADHILVMDQGRIIEEGTHEALLQQKGLYARLAHLQFS